MKKLVFICHSNYIDKEKIVDANWSITFGFLNHYFIDSYTVLRHSLYKDGESRIYSKGINGSFKKIPLVGSFPDPIRYIAEIIINFTYLALNKPEIVIAIDPLSCSAATFLKKIHYIKEVFFITPDFAKKRFDNKILNKIYFLLDRFCTLYSTKNIVCAKTVIDYKKEIYKDSVKQDIFFHLPNIPNPWEIEKLKNITKISNRIIYVGNISQQINFIDLFNAFSNLSIVNPSLSLVIAGKGDYENELKKFTLDNNIKNITFLGQLSYEDTLLEIAKSEIGIALYTGAFNYDEFRDSCKIREYQALSVIPLASSVVKSNADEIKLFNSGLLINSYENIFSEIKKLSENIKLKNQLAINSLKNYQVYKDIYQKFYNLIINI